MFRRHHNSPQLRLHPSRLFLPQLLSTVTLQKKEFLAEELLRRLSTLQDSPHTKPLSSQQHGFQTEGRKLKNWLTGLLPTATRINRLGTPEIAGQRLINGQLSSWGSINCLGDEVRTKRFCQAVKKSILDLDKVKADRMEVVDSGCGAFPLFAILACLCSPKVHVTALEMNINSVKIARDFVRIFGLESRIKIVHADATKWVPEKEIDLIISETIDKALTNEPIAQIIPNLFKFGSSECVCIPELINIHLGVYWKANRRATPEPDHVWKYLGADLDMTTPIAPLEEIDQFLWISNQQASEIRLSGVIGSHIKNSTNLGDPYLVAWADIKIYDDITLNLGESIISSLAVLGKCPDGKRAASVTYRPGTLKEVIRPEFYA